MVTTPARTTILLSTRCSIHVNCFEACESFTNKYVATRLQFFSSGRCTSLLIRFWKQLLHPLVMCFRSHCINFGIESVSDSFVMLLYFFHGLVVIYGHKRQRKSVSQFPRNKWCIASRVRPTQQTNHLELSRFDP